VIEGTTTADSAATIVVGKGADSRAVVEWLEGTMTQRTRKYTDGVVVDVGRYGVIGE